MVLGFCFGGDMSGYNLNLWDYIVESGSERRML